MHSLWLTGKKLFKPRMNIKQTNIYKVSQNITNRIVIPITKAKIYRNIVSKNKIDLK